MSQLYDKYRQQLQKLADIESAIGLMSWDQEVNMPDKGMRFRSRQLATLAGMAYIQRTSPEFEEILQGLSAKKDELTGEQQRNLKRSLRQLEKEKKLDQDFVERKSRVESEAFEAWLKAKAAKNFSQFLPKLREIIEISREKAERLGYEEHPYDALLDEFEPELKVSFLDPLFTQVRSEIVDVVNQVRDQNIPDPIPAGAHFSIDKQLQLCKAIAQVIGYDFGAGRLDLSPHPFSISFSPEDSRITTRLDEHDFTDSLWSTIHEVGHALYEQGLLTDNYGLPAGEAASLSIHESQSRLWENNVGKSEGFIQAFWPLFQDTFPEALGQVKPKDFYRSLNRIAPNLIRIQSDEVTYHLHILLRYEIEKGLIEGKIEAASLEEVWNEKIKEYLGLDVPNAAMGVLQDIHWSHGSIGYFPTYSLGSFYAAQFFAAAKHDLPNLQEQIHAREYAPLLLWLREKVHRHGKLYTSDELCRMATGSELDFRYFKDYLTEKYSKVYESE